MTTTTPLNKTLIIELLKVKQEAKEGKLFTGDLDVLAKRFLFLNTRRIKK